MRIAVTGASGNVGSQVLRQLLERPEVEGIVGLARRPPEPDGAGTSVDGTADTSAESAPGAGDPRVRWVECDVSTDDAVPVLQEGFAGADVVIHLAWQIQPGRDEAGLWQANVGGSTRVLAATLAAGVGALVYVSSIGAYAAGPKDSRVDETWPAAGIRTSSYSRHKAEVERLLDGAQLAGAPLRIVRMRPGLIFQAMAASEILRYFAGPLVPVTMLRRGRLPVVPRVHDLVAQAVHTADVAAALVTAALGDARGAFNLAAEPVLDIPTIAAATGAWEVPLPGFVLRALVDLSWRARLQPTEPGWLDLARQVPLMDTTRARAELGWVPRHSSTDALRELLAAMAEGRGGGSPVLKPLAGVATRLGIASRGQVGT